MRPNCHLPDSQALYSKVIFRKCFLPKMCFSKSMIARTLLYNIDFQMTAIFTGSFFLMSGMYVIRA